MATVGNNMDGKKSHVRDSFFSSKGEKEYFEKLMQDPKERSIHAKALRMNADTLYKKAMDLINRVEAGEFNEEQMAKVEYMISHYLAGIDDLHKELILELTL